jgi:transposase
MLHRHAIQDADWDRIKDLLPGQPGQHGKVAKDHRLFLDAVLWIAKTGAPWRDLPERFGPWNSVWRRFDRWAQTGVWRRVFEALQDPDLEGMLLDSTVVRAHQHAAGARKKKTAAGFRGRRLWGGAGAGSRPRSTSAPTPSATRSGSA